MAPKRTSDEPSKKRPRSNPPQGTSFSKGASSSRATSALTPPTDMSTEQKQRFNEMVSKKVIKSHSVVDWEILREYGLKHAVRRLIGEGPWCKLFSIKEKAYKHPTYAFMTTFKLKHDFISTRLQNEVEFFAFGRMHRVDMFDFIKAMKIYTTEEMDDEDFNDLPVLLPGDVNANPSRFWFDISHESTFKPSKSKASNLKTTSARIFHYMLVRTIYGKMDSPGAVGEQDLLALYSVLRNYEVNVGVLAAFGIRRQTFDTSKGIFVGGLITRILTNLHLWPGSDRPTDSCAEPQPLPRAPFNQWGIPMVDDPDIDVEAPGTEIHGAGTTSFSAGNLTMLHSEVVEMKGQIKEIQTNQQEIKENQRGIMSLLRSIADRMGVVVPSCFSCSAPTEEGEPSHPPTTAEHQEHPEPFEEEQPVPDPLREDPPAARPAEDTPSTSLSLVLQDPPAIPQEEAPLETSLIIPYARRSAQPPAPIAPPSHAIQDSTQPSAPTGVTDGAEQEASSSSESDEEEVGSGEDEEGSSEEEESSGDSDKTDD